MESRDAVSHIDQEKSLASSSRSQSLVSSAYSSESEEQASSSGGESGHEAHSELSSAQSEDLESSLEDSQERGLVRRGAHCDSSKARTSIHEIFQETEHFNAGKKRRYHPNVFTQHWRAFAYQQAAQLEPKTLLDQCSNVLGVPVDSDVAKGEALSSQSYKKLSRASKQFDAFLRKLKGDLGIVERGIMALCEAVPMDCLPTADQSAFSKLAGVSLCTIRAMVAASVKKRQELLAASYDFSLPPQVSPTTQFSVESSHFQDMLRTYREDKLLDARISRKRPYSQNFRGGRSQSRGRGGRRSHNFRAPPQTQIPHRQSFSQAPSPPVRGNGRGGRGG
jgi:hypothetical protein